MNYKQPSTFEIRTSLTPDECKAILLTKIDETSIFNPFSGVLGSNQIKGRIDYNNICLERKTFYRNSFKPVFKGTICSNENGSIISGNFAIHSFVRVFMFIWFAMVILIGGTVFITSIIALFRTGCSNNVGSLFGIIIPVSLLIFGYALIHFCKYHSRNEEQFIKDFLTEIFNKQATSRPSRHAPIFSSKAAAARLSLPSGR